MPLLINKIDIYGGQDISVLAGKMLMEFIIYTVHMKSKISVAYVLTGAHL